MLCIVSFFLEIIAGYFNKWYDRLMKALNGGGPKEEAILLPLDMPSPIQFLIKMNC